MSVTVTHADCWHECPHCHRSYGHLMDKIYGCLFNRFRPCGCRAEQILLEFKETE